MWYVDTVSKPNNHTRASQPEVADTSNQGLAFTFRPQRTVTHHQRISATRVVSTSRTVYSDGILVDYLHAHGRLDDLEHAAAVRVYGLFLAAGLSPRVTPRVDMIPDEALVEMADGSNDDDAQDAALYAYRGLLRRLGQPAGPVLDAVMHGQYPGVSGMRVVRQLLCDLAREWGMR